MPAPDYAAQNRGGLGAYERYLAGMDASMRQKVALTAAHLLCEGRVADMGMGSGQGSHALAALYPRLEVVGVDIDATMVALAREQYRAPNLSFVDGDIGRAVFPDGSLDGIFDSSVLHHVTSYRGYRHENAADALTAQVAELKPHGVLVVRDFLDPGAAPVFLEVPADDGDHSGDHSGDDSQDPLRCSTAALLERFAREFRSLAPHPGCPVERIDGGGGLPPLPKGWRRYRLSHKHAAEFVLRKDYRTDWASEIKEEYTYFTQAQFEGLFARLGLRVLASTPLRNPWIVRHRFQGRFELRDAGGLALDFPATNYVIVGEKVPDGEGVEFRRAGGAPPRGFLRMEHYRHAPTGKVYDLAARPFPTVDIIPFFDVGGLIYVLARTSYPRPILRDRVSLEGAHAPGYLAEPLNVIQTDRPLGLTVEEALSRAAGLGPEIVRRLEAGTTYYPSPGGIMEEVRSVFVEIEPTFMNTPVEGVSGFSTSGRVRAIEARQLLRAAQVGGLPDARLELNVHELLLRLGHARGPWIGEEIQLGASAAPPGPATLGPDPQGRARRAFARAEESAGFLSLESHVFEELDARGNVLFRQAFEYVMPVPLGTNTVAVAILAGAGGGSGDVLMGLDEDDLPAAQAFSGNSNLLVAPAWRLPREVSSLRDARAWVAERLAAEYGVAIGETWELGGAYRPSPGLTPESVFPLAVEASGVSPGRRPLRWVPLRELVSRRAELPDGHLRVLSLRASHALARGDAG
jgi:SAM-dependent methyltransferase